jgi:hypothetical protein
MLLELGIKCDVQLADSVKYLTVKCKTVPYVEWIVTSRGALYGENQ